MLFHVKDDPQVQSHHAVASRSGIHGGIIAGIVKVSVVEPVASAFPHLGIDEGERGVALVGTDIDTAMLHTLVSGQVEVIARRAWLAGVQADASGINAPVGLGELGAHPLGGLYETDKHPWLVTVVLGGQIDVALAIDTPFHRTVLKMAKPRILVVEAVSLVTPKDAVVVAAFGVFVKGTTERLG